MSRREAEQDCRCVIQVHGFSCEDRNVLLVRLYRAFAASGCWTVGYRRRGRRSVEYSFDLELGQAVELYCGLVEAGLELTESSHRTLTDVCVLRAHQALSHGPSRCVRVRVVTS